MRLVCLGGAGEIGANSYFIGGARTAVLLDTGLHPKREGPAALPRLDAIPDDVAHIIITHAHLDHVGALPAVARRMPRARIHASETTLRFALRMLRNSANVMRRRHEQGGPLPLYGFDAVEALDELIEPHVEDEAVDLGRGAKVRFVPAGHIPGAAGVLLELDGRTLFYTGDTCGAAQWLVPAARYPRGPVDVLLTESTYGSNPVADTVVREQVVERFAAAITDVVKGGGRVLVPVFALGRAQELLYLVTGLRAAGRLPDVPIYLTGLARAVTRLYDETRHATPRLDPGLRLERLDFNMLDDGLLDSGGPPGPALILASSGMLVPNTISNRMARSILPEPNDALFIVGYQDPDSPGFRVQHSQLGDAIDLGAGPDGPSLPVERRCALERFHFRAHSTRGELLAAAQQVDPRLAVLVHGDPGASAWLAGRFADSGRQTLLPEPARGYDV